MITAPVEQLGAAFKKNGYSLYAVGGMVRNPLLGLPISDMDVTTDALPEESLRIGKELGLICVPKAVGFGTVELVARDKSWSVECTTFRSDVYGPGGFHRPEGVRFSKSLEQDAFRRDFTANAVYQNAVTGEFADPTGGLADIESRVLRATAKDPNVIMQDDGLRVLRLVRFACELGFSAEEATFLAARENARGLFDIPAERKLAELKKILLSDARYASPQPGGEHAVLRALRLMKDLGAFEFVIPELTESDGFPQNPKYHAYDVLTHSFHVAAFAPPALSLRFAALLHDVAKPRTFKETGTMHGHEVLGEKMAREILLRLKAERALTDRVCPLIRWHMYDLDGRAKEKTLKKQFSQWGPEFVAGLASLRIADVFGSGLTDRPAETAQRWLRVLSEMMLKNTPFSENDLAITGRDLAELGYFGPKIGEVKRALWLHCAVSPEDNQKARLFRLAKSYGGTKTPR